MMFNMIMTTYPSEILCPHKTIVCLKHTMPLRPSQPLVAHKLLAQHFLNLPPSTTWPFTSFELLSCLWLCHLQLQPIIVNNNLFDLFDGSALVMRATTTGCCRLCPTAFTVTTKCSCLHTWCCNCTQRMVPPPAATTASGVTLMDKSASGTLAL